MFVGIHRRCRWQFGIYTAPGPTSTHWGEEQATLLRCGTCPPTTLWRSGQQREPTQRVLEQSSRSLVLQSRQSTSMHLVESSAIFSAPHLQHDTLARRDILAPTVSCTQATSARTLALKSTKPFWRQTNVDTVQVRQFNKENPPDWKHNGAWCKNPNK